MKCKHSPIDRSTSVYFPLKHHLALGTISGQQNWPEQRALYAPTLCQNIVACIRKRIKIFKFLCRDRFLFSHQISRTNFKAGWRSHWLVELHLTCGIDNKLEAAFHLGLPLFVPDRKLFPKSPKFCDLKSFPKILTWNKKLQAQLLMFLTAQLIRLP